MRPLHAPSFKIVPVDEALRLTGLNPAELRSLPSVQWLTRVFADGRREHCIRIPLHLLDGADAG